MFKSHNHELLRITYEKDPRFGCLTAKQKNMTRSSLISGAVVFVAINFVYKNYGKKISYQDVLDMRLRLFE